MLLQGYTSANAPIFLTIVKWNCLMYFVLQYSLNATSDTLRAKGKTGGLSGQLEAPKRQVVLTRTCHASVATKRRDQSSTR